MILFLKEALNRAGVAPDQVDEVILGNVLQAGLGQNPARQALIKAGLPDSVSAMTINKVCGSGLESIALAGISIEEIRKVVQNFLSNESLSYHEITKEECLLFRKTFT